MSALRRVARGKVAWAGTSVHLMLGGVGRNQERTTIELPSIIALKGRPMPHTDARIQPTRRALFARDRHMCAYCVHVFDVRELTRDASPQLVKFGPWVECRRCNQLKGCEL
jgi:hypothetical protein